MNGIGEDVVQHRRGEEFGRTNNYQYYLVTLSCRDSEGAADSAYYREEHTITLGPGIGFVREFSNAWGLESY